MPNKLRRRTKHITITNNLAGGSKPCAHCLVLLKACRVKKVTYQVRGVRAGSIGTATYTTVTERVTTMTGTLSSGHRALLR